MNVSRGKMKIFDWIKKNNIQMKYFITGVITFVLVIIVSSIWYPCIQYISGQPLWYATQPAILRFIFDKLGYIPWVVGLILIIIGAIKRSWKRPLYYFGGLVFCYIVFISLLIGGPILKDVLNRQKFDSVIWKQSLAEKGNTAIRIKMVNSLLRKHNLVGMTRKQIDDLLGKPPKTAYFSDYEYVYWLGPERGFISIDSEWLGIKFQDDKVIEARLLRD